MLLYLHLGSGEARPVFYSQMCPLKSYMQCPVGNGTQVLCAALPESLQWPDHVCGDVNNRQGGRTYCSHCISSTTLSSSRSSEWRIKMGDPILGTWTIFLSCQLIFKLGLSCRSKMYLTGTEESPT